MQIELHNIGKRFNREWIFKDVNFSFDQSERTAIIGSNGSGKSTLLKIISAAEIPSSGKLIVSDENRVNIALNDIFSRISFAAPYADLPEELSPSEIFNLTNSFNPFHSSVDLDRFLDLTYLKDSSDKFIRYFSSGMKQRLKLGLAICSNSNILLLDEPCSNLDSKGISTYYNLMEEFTDGKIVIIGSNEQKEEMIGVNRSLNIMDYK